jgi:hypothetical protein
MANQQPSHRVFTVIKREGHDDYWIPIGAAFPHQSGGGFNVILQALPIPDRTGQCKIVLRPPKNDSESDAERGSRARRQASDRRQGTSR